MPLLDPLHQGQRAGRTKGAVKTYVTTLVTDKGTAAHTGDTITFTNLEIELDGERFKATKALDLGNVSSLLSAGKTYTICAVASYTEPVSQSAAEAANLEYYVEQNSKGEAIAYRFFPSDVLAQLNAAGGIDQVKQNRFFNPSAADNAAYTAYYETLERLRDPKFVIKALTPSGYDLILREVKWVDNTASNNVLSGKTRQEFRTIRSQVGELMTQRKILTGAQMTSAYGSALWLIKTAKSYTSLANAQTDTSGTNVIAAIQAADNAGTSYTFSASHYVIHEYILPGTTDIGQTAKGWIPVKTIDRQSSSFLGRMNPIYLDNQALHGTVRLERPELKRLTQYAYPCELARITWDGTAITSATYTYDTGM